MLSPGASVPSPFGPPPPGLKPAKPVVRRVIDYRGDPEPDNRSIVCVTQPVEALDLIKEKVPVILVSEGLRSCKVLIIATKTELVNVVAGLKGEQVEGPDGYVAFNIPRPVSEVGPVFERYFGGDKCSHRTGMI